MQPLVRSTRADVTHRGRRRKIQDLVPTLVLGGFFDAVELSAVQAFRNALRGTTHRVATLGTFRRDGPRAVHHRCEGGGTASDENLLPRRVRRSSAKARLNHTHQEITEDAIERATETAGSGRRVTNTRAAILAKERAKPIEDDDKGLLVTMGKQIKELCT
ncbi:hypothetical protein CTAM01_16030 [Colletotrichum tamarilloi]|uniref:Uncharacterized protein n=1 Tax=Colletotrichum tamarilloi TaxID=1209934 RepID=A0ABQ9QJL9_9PEZI|nr:uncharacterized protein CTAM01_16030 [Colletotrichum tamarilloi]KAK1474001.1 hypothetical protein CTAM01_16030 [Colletotrichum tamarilloi]